MESEKKEVKAIFEKDLREALSKIGLLEKIERGEVLCKFCRTPITIDTLHSIIPESGAYNVVCDKPECVTKLTEYLEDKKRVEN
jgi:hypothetical protein